MRLSDENLNQIPFSYLICYLNLSYDNTWPTITTARDKSYDFLVAESNHLTYYGRVWEQVYLIFFRCLPILILLKY